MYALLTERDLLSRFWRQSEREQRHGGDENTRNDEVKAIEQSTSADVYSERDVDVLFRTTIVLLHVTLRRHAYHTQLTKTVS